ncbi:MAG: hypothetical protein LN568_04060 [Rickettsia endosymbiont of Pseudomimeciton antennatum]|nr:hypothetical protein [Rickettsia endosymbiont of Pseudomimeciton antennatum]MCC8398729.1 hypothetical protein [Rickettsia endosymbiont of Labidopullus appendiculatus]
MKSNRIIELQPISTSINNNAVELTKTNEDITSQEEESIALKLIGLCTNMCELFKHIVTHTVPSDDCSVDSINPDEAVSFMDKVNPDKVASSPDVVNHGYTDHQGTVSLAGAESATAGGEIN